MASPCCNLITSLLPHPVCGRGTNRLGINHLITCVSALKFQKKKAEFVLYRGGEKYTIFYSSSTWCHRQKYLPEGWPYMLMFPAVYSGSSTIYMCAPKKTDKSLPIFTIIETKQMSLTQDLKYC